MNKSMQKIILTVGLPASGKSTWAKAEIAKDPNSWCRVNNDDIRAMLNGSVYSPDYEKLITETRNFLIREGLKRGKSVIIDNLNIARRHFDDVVKIARSVNGNFQVFEKPFYVELEEAIARDAKREGKAQVGETVLKKWWKESGGKQHKFYKARTEIITTQSWDAPVIEPPAHVEGAPEAVICDLDGTFVFIRGRSPYDASKCEFDPPNRAVIETLLAHDQKGRKIIFCSGREDKYREQTIRSIEKHLKFKDSDGEVWGCEYQLHMRKSDDFRKDSIIKEEIYKEHIKDKYNILNVLDDRDQVVSLWRSLGLQCFQVAPGAF